MEKSLQKDIEAVEDELLLVQTQLNDLLERQETLLEKKRLLQSQLDTLVTTRDHEESARFAHAQSVDWENGHFEWSDKLSSVLKSRFKIDSFRPLQLSTINATLSGEDVILIMPTGGGKSLCYQLPTLIEAGVSLVISPLVSLMEDQLLAVKCVGIEAAMLNASSSREEVSRVHSAMTDAKKGASLRLLYVTPEKLSKSKRFMSKLEKMYEMGRLSRIVIDEVHCASQWGHDFRPDYKILGVLKRQFPKTPILGLTATATSKVLADCQDILSLKSCLTFRASYNRPNLFYEVRYKPSSLKAQVEEIAGLIKTKFTKQSGIVYCLSRNNAEEMCMELCRVGISTGCYHADRLPSDRTRVHTQWLNNSLQVIVATIAFGMGIDKPDVRFVIHHSLSKSMENYYQESGRAGRDGNTAHCILFYRSADAFRQSAMVFTDHMGLSNLSTMMSYCINEVECRRSLVAKSFGEKWTPEDCSGACDVCVKLSGGHKGSVSVSATDSSALTGPKYQVVSNDVSQHAKSLVLIIEHNQAKQQRLTAAKLVDIWRGQQNSSRPAHVSSANMPIEQCERMVVTALLQGVLKEEFHYTAYTTICYMGLGRKAQLAKRGLLNIEISSLSVCKAQSNSSSKPRTSQSTKQQETHCRNTDTTQKTTPAKRSSRQSQTGLTGTDSQQRYSSQSAKVSSSEVSHLPSMIPSGATSSLLFFESGKQTSSLDQTPQASSNQTVTVGSLKGRKRRGGLSLGKGKKQECNDVESTSKKLKSDFSPMETACDVIEIIDDDSD